MFCDLDDVTIRYYKKLKSPRDWVSAMLAKCRKSGVSNLQFWDMECFRTFMCSCSICFFVVFDECRHYEVLNDRERAAGRHRGNILKCDQRDLVTPKWYRFTGAAGAQMPTACVPKHYCGTHAPGWLSGSHPTRVGQVVNGKVCFHWGSNCCNWNAAIQIKKCNGFYVYKLSRTPVCWLRYCGNAGFGELGIAYFSFFLCMESRITEFTLRFWAFRKDIRWICYI